MIRNDLVLSPVDDADGINQNSPIIGWHNLVERTGLVADSEDPNFPASNLANPATHLLWKSLSSAAQKIRVSSVAGETIDYVGLANHNLGTIGASVQIIGTNGLLYDFDPSRKSTNMALSGSNLIATYSGGGTNYGSAFAVDAMAENSGFYIAEWSVGNIVTDMVFGIGNSSALVTETPSSYIGGTANGIGMASGGGVITNNVFLSGVDCGTIVDGSVIQMAVDTRLRLIWFRIDNGDWNGVSDANPFTRTGGIDAKSVTGSWFFGVSMLGNTSAATALATSPVSDAFVPADDRPILFRFEPSIYSTIDVRIGAGSSEPQAGVLYAGFLLVLQRRINAGHTPINYGRRANIVNGMSENGAFLGRIMLGSNLAANIDLSNIDRQWYRDVMDPFVEAAQTEPFFWGWRPYTFPSEVAYCWATAPFEPVNQKYKLMSISIPIAGIDT